MDEARRDDLPVGARGNFGSERWRQGAAVTVPRAAPADLTTNRSRTNGKCPTRRALLFFDRKP